MDEFEKYFPILIFFLGVAGVLTRRSLQFRILYMVLIINSCMMLFSQMIKSSTEKEFLFVFFSCVLFLVFFVFCGLVSIVIGKDSSDAFEDKKFYEVEE